MQKSNCRGWPVQPICKTGFIYTRSTNFMNMFLIYLYILPTNTGDTRSPLQSYSKIDHRPLWLHVRVCIKGRLQLFISSSSLTLLSL